jgi:hypothetical protein
MTEIVDEMYEGATKGLLVVEPGYRIEKGTTTLEQALDPHAGERSADLRPADVGRHASIFVRSREMTARRRSRRRRLTASSSARASEPSRT